MTTKTTSKLTLFVAGCVVLLVAGTAAMLYHASQSNMLGSTAPAESAKPKEAAPATPKISLAELYYRNRGNPLGIKLAQLYDPEPGGKPAENVSDSAVPAPNYFEFARVHQAATQEFIALNSELQLNRFAKANEHFVHFIKYLKADMNAGRKTESDMFFYSEAYGLIGMFLADLKAYESALQQLQTAIYSDQLVQDNYIVRSNLFTRMGNERQSEVWRKKALQAPKVQTYPTWAKKNKLCQMPAASK